MEKTIISSSKKVGLTELWKYRELFFFLVWRDIIVRYKQTTIGILWALLQPFVTMVVFTFLFGTVANIETFDIPYPVFMYTGLIFWNFFSRSITSSSESLIANQNLFKRAYFPKLILPISSIIVNFVDFFFAAIILVGLLLYFHHIPSISGIILIPVGLIAICLLSIGIGSILALLNLKFRDTRFLTSYALQILLFLTPIAYPASVAKGKYVLLFAFNPLSGIIGNIRAQLLGGQPFNLYTFGFSVAVSFLVFYIGISYFFQKERFATDLV